jgi:hypothetical protein
VSRDWDSCVTVDPGQGFHDKDGEFRHVHRFSLFWGGDETSYSLRSAVSHARPQAAREIKGEMRWQNEVEKDAAASLFPDFVREQAEKARKQTKGRGR